MTSRAPAPFTPRARIPAEEVELLRHYLPLIVGTRLQDWERAIVVGAIAQIKRGPWWPSERQAPVVDRWRKANLGGAE